MVTPELLNYIKTQRQAGVVDDAIRGTLTVGGWRAEDVDEAFRSLSGTPTSISAPSSSAPIGASELLKQSWTLYRQRFWTFVGILAIPMAFIFILAMLIGGSAALVGMFSSSALVKTTGLVALIAAIVVVVCIAIVLGIWGQIALLIAIRDNAEAIGIRTAYQRARPFIGGYFWISLIVGLISIGGFLLLIVPGIIFAVWFSFATVIFVVENERGMNALLKSKAYVQGRWGYTFWRQLVVGVIYVIISLLISGLVGLLAWLGGSVAGPAGQSIMGGLSTIIQNVISIFIAPFIPIYIYLLYQNLRSLKGEVNVTSARRAPYIIVAVLGLLIIPALLATLAFVPLSLNNAQVKARDARRIADIKQIQVALELSSNDASTTYQSAYPNWGTKAAPITFGQPPYDTITMNGIVYMSVVPVNPTPGGEPYLYRATDGQGNDCTTVTCPDYELTFSLEDTAGVYSAGPHVATQNGIK